MSTTSNLHTTSTIANYSGNGIETANFTTQTSEKIEVVMAMIGIVMVANLLLGTPALIEADYTTQTPDNEEVEADSTAPMLDNEEGEITRLECIKGICKTIGIWIGRVLIVIIISSIISVVVGAAIAGALALFVFIMESISFVVVFQALLLPIGGLWAALAFLLCLWGSVIVLSGDLP